MPIGRSFREGNNDEDKRVISNELCGDRRHRLGKRDGGRPLPVSAQATAAPAIDNDDIGGVVTGPNGPEAGVWVIAETAELPTKFAKIVVTDDQGRYVIPDLPAANYSVWVRGYGRYSAKMRAKPGQILIGRNSRPERSGSSALLSRDLLVFDDENSAGKRFETYGNIRDPGASKMTNWLRQMKNIGCMGCHQIGQEATRTIPVISARSIRAREPGCGACNPVSQVSRWPPSRAFSAASLQISRRLDDASPMANCRKALRRGHRASSAMSSSRPGNGAPKRRTCTILFLPIGAIRRSTPMARCSARPNMPATTCRSWIRRRVK